MVGSGVTSMISVFFTSYSIFFSYFSNNGNYCDFSYNSCFSNSGNLVISNGISNLDLDLSMLGYYLVSDSFVLLLSKNKSRILLVDYLNRDS